MRELRVVVRVVLFASFVVMGNDLHGQRLHVGPDAAGTKDEFVYNITAPQYVAISGTPQYVADILVRPATNETVELISPIRLPSGARIVRVRTIYYDNHPGLVGGGQIVTTNLASDDSATAPESPFQEGSPNFLLVAVLPQDISIDNDNKTYTYRIRLFRTDAAFQAVYKVQVFYKLEVKPAPGAATFGDVPVTHPFFQFIEALAASGITAGCTATTPPNYCPDSPVTRGQMAVFLSRALGLHWTP